MGTEKKKHPILPFQLRFFKTYELKYIVLYAQTNPLISKGYENLKKWHLVILFYDMFKIK